MPQFFLHYFFSIAHNLKPLVSNPLIIVNIVRAVSYLLLKLIYSSDSYSCDFSRNVGKEKKGEKKKER